jgi:predicted Zn-dependent protease
MNLAEKFSQKLNNLKSKKDIADFFIYFDEARSLSIKTQEGAVGEKNHPTSYKELTDGTFLIIWPDKRISTGTISTSSSGSFDEFINNAKKSARQVNAEVFIPERGIYPMVRTYSKVVADMIDLPEYLLKLTDILDEMDKMIQADGKAEILILDGSRFGYSSRNLDEYFPYTKFVLKKIFEGYFTWIYTSPDILSIYSFQELFSFLGDIYNIQKTKPVKLKSGKFNLVIQPKTFNQLFDEQILDNINGKNVIEGLSIFNSDDFKTRKKAYGSMSISYDPLLNQKLGSYKFTRSGLKPQKQYFIKFGKLETPILDNLNFSELGYKCPSMSIDDFSNIKIEGLRKKTFDDLRKESESYIFAPDFAKCIKKNKHKHKLFSTIAVNYENGKGQSTGKFAVEIDLSEIISNGDAELIEFIDGQIGLLIKSLYIRFI